MCGVFKIVISVFLALSALHAQETLLPSSHPANTEPSVNLPENSEDSSSSGEPLTFDQGLSVIAAALEYGHHHRKHLDCSHLVHAIYQAAGFDYAYSPSSVLYAGFDAFERVAYPQPGDIVTWKGHVGIMVNPAQHAFYSALRTGKGVERYDSPYWRKRGHPRFYRYVLPPSDYATEAHAH